jgi:HK97 gp10 family phage protein
MQVRVMEALRLWAEAVKEEAQAIVPVRSGYLRSTIYAEIADWIANIGAEATYAAFVEFGTRRMMARPYLQPALEMYLPQLEQIVADAIEAAKGDAGF